MSEEEWEWFAYWNGRLWAAVARGDEEAEEVAIGYLYCKPVIERQNEPAERLCISDNQLVEGASDKQDQLE